jgi:hypothetical protein
MCVSSQVFGEAVTFLNKPSGGNAGHSLFHRSDEQECLPFGIYLKRLIFISLTGDRPG